MSEEETQEAPEEEKPVEAPEEKPVEEAEAETVETPAETPEAKIAYGKCPSCDYKIALAEGQMATELKCPEHDVTLVRIEE